MGLPYTQTSPAKSYSQNSASKIDKAMNPEQFNQVVDAILEGKYSWACVLILRFTGYNPCHYIPRRTYTRLVKENLQAIRRDRPQTNTAQASLSSNRLPDLTYLEVLNEQHAEIHGGRLDPWVGNQDNPFTWLTNSVEMKKLLHKFF